MEHAEKLLAQAVAERLAALKSNAFAAEKAAGLPSDAIRSILRGVKKSGTTLNKAMEVCQALGIELYIGPPRESGLQPPDAELSSLVNIPLHEAFLAAGEGVENSTECISGHVAFNKDWLRKIGLSPSNAALARAKGDSMQPVIWDGDLLLIDRTKVEPPPIWKGERGKRFAPVFALLDDGQAKVKRLQMLDHGVAMLISDNPDYPPQFAKPETLTIIGKVMWWGHTSKE